MLTIQFYCMLRIEQDYQRELIYFGFAVVVVVVVVVLVVLSNSIICHSRFWIDRYGALQRGRYPLVLR